MGWWKSKVAYQMLSCFCMFRNFTPSWRMAPLALLLLFSSYRLLGFIFFTSLTLLFSTLVFMWKQKAVADDELAQGSGFSLSFSGCTSEEKRPHGRESVAPTPMHNHETVRHVKESEEEQVSDVDVVDDDDDDEDAPSESEWQEVLFLSSSEEYEVDHTPECSDGTISDEDSLIEIALPSGHFVGHNQREDSNKYNNKNKKNNCCSLQQKKRELSAHEALFNQQSLMELFAEFNEEENLIEIDIAMGSIKCSRFEIEA